MPTYEYLCSSCGHEWEAEQSIKADPLTDCPACKAASAKRQISRGTGFILKGGGWYSDLYSGSSNKTGSNGPSESSSSKNGDASTSTSTSGSVSTTTTTTPTSTTTTHTNTKVSSGS